jgi:beta-phosphoglucomutase-like phosphatase (HAD superfamily)
LSSFCDS